MTFDYLFCTLLLTINY